jgi:hypothetical protein
MTDPARGSLRLLRALGLLATVTGLVLGAHMAGGGAVAPVPAAAVAALLWPGALLAARRRVRLALLLPGLAAGQVAGHALLALLGASTAAAPTSVTVACLEHAGHLHPAAAACLAADGYAPVAHHAMGSVLPSGSMLVTHLIATVVAAVLVTRGEAIIWRLVDLVAPRRPRIVGPATVRAVVRGAVRAAIASPSVPSPTGRAPPVPA